jgi:hypothetical protein
MSSVSNASNTFALLLFLQINELCKNQVMSTEFTASTKKYKPIIYKLVKFIGTESIKQFEHHHIIKNYFMEQGPS